MNKIIINIIIINVIRKYDGNKNNWPNKYNNTYYNEYNNEYYNKYNTKNVYNKYDSIN